MFNIKEQAKHVFPGEGGGEEAGSNQFMQIRRLNLAIQARHH